MTISRSTVMPVSTNSPDDLKRARVRASEFKRFRRDYLYSQRYLADALQCSRRTIVAIESMEVINPHVDLLRKFRDLKQRLEQDRRARQAKQEVATWSK